MTHKTTSTVLSAAFAAALIVTTGAAQAGFEWSAPKAPAVQQAEPNPVAPVDTMSLDAQSSALDAMPVEEDAAMAPVAATPAPAAQPKAPAAPQTAMAAPGDIVEGFGSDVTLAIALRQIAPAQYQFAFDDEIDLSQLVSWQGGKPWKIVLGDLLGSLGHGMRVDGNIVFVSSRPVMPEPQTAELDMQDMMPDPVPAPTAGRQQADSGVKPFSDLYGTQNKAGAGNVDEKAEKESKWSWLSPVNLFKKVKPADEAPEAETMRKSASTDKATSYVPSGSRMSGSSAPEYKSPAQMMEQKSEAGRTAGSETPYYAPSGTKTAMQTDQGQETEAVEWELDGVSSAQAEDDVISGTHVSESDLEWGDEPAALTEPPNMAKPAVGAAWNAGSGETLRKVLQDWSRRAGVEFHWTVDIDYRLSDSVALNGTYEEAVAEILNDFSTVTPQPYGQLHRSKDGGKTLVVKTYDEP